MIDIKIKDANVPLPKAFIKLGKFEHMKNYIDKGELRFSPPSVFNHMQEGADKIADKYEGRCIIQYEIFILLHCYLPMKMVKMSTESL